MLQGDRGAEQTLTHHFLSFLFKNVWWAQLLSSLGLFQRTYHYALSPWSPQLATINKNKKLKERKKEKTQLDFNSCFQSYIRKIGMYTVLWIERYIAIDIGNLLEGTVFGSGCC